MTGLKGVIQKRASAARHQYGRPIVPVHAAAREKLVDDFLEKLVTLARPNRPHGSADLKRGERLA